MIAKVSVWGIFGLDLNAQNAEEATFLLWGLRDNDTAPLQRLQITKAWLEDS